VKPFKLTNDSSYTRILEVCMCSFIKNCQGSINIQFVYNLKQWALELNQSENDLEEFTVPHGVIMQNTTV